MPTLPPSRRPPRKKRPLWIRLLVILVSLGLLAAGGLAGAVWYLAKDLPPVDSLLEYQPSLVTGVYSDDGRKIGQFFIERRILTPLNAIPKELYQAIIAVEDSRFFQHEGLDIFGIIRATLTNIEALRIRQGASTITQQLARSVFLTPERSFGRKIKEAILAIHMEKTLTKDRILELYLNEIYFGHGAYGVAAASQTYFGKEVSQLSPAESAVLASLPKAPALYSPFSHPERAQQRQHHVLKRMKDEGFITETQYMDALATPLEFRRREPEVIAPYFIDAVRQYLLAKYGETMVYKGGLHVQTTLNIEAQQAAEQAVRAGLRKLDKRQGYRGPLSPEAINAPHASNDGHLTGVVTKVDKKSAWVRVGDMTGMITLDDMKWASRRLTGNDVKTDVRVIEHPTADRILNVGDVIKVARQSVADLSERVHSQSGGGMAFTLEQTPRVEGALLALDPKTGAIRAMVGGYDFNRSEYNRATVARRQPGSAFKPIIYTAAVKRGMTPVTILIDSPVVYQDWRPVNYEQRFYGPITLRDALIHSRNVATIKLLEKIGVHPVHELARAFGIQSPLDSYLSLALGSSSVTLEELTAAYAVFANNGVRLTPYMIAAVTDANGKLLEEHHHRPDPVLSPETAYLVTNMLEDVIQRGTGRKARVIQHAVAGKTGTTNDFTDAWFIGFSPHIVAGVWVGFDTVRSLGERQSGARAALPIWIDFMRHVLAASPDDRFLIPENIVRKHIDPHTGRLANQSDKDARTEFFIRGSEPVEESHTPLDPIDFITLDRSTP